MNKESFVEKVDLLKYLPQLGDEIVWPAEVPVHIGGGIADRPAVESGSRYLFFIPKEVTFKNLRVRPSFDKLVLAALHLVESPLHEARAR